jgi:hypothetical protein
VKLIDLPMVPNTVHDGLNGYRVSTDVSIGGAWRGYSSATMSNDGCCDFLVIDETFEMIFDDDENF